MTKKITSLFLATLTVVFTICLFTVSASAATSISKASVSYTSTYTYTGKAIKPKVTVKLNGKTLNAKNYSVSYSDNKAPGKAKITIKGKGSYTGTITKYFYIKPKAVSSLKGTPASSSSIKLTWNKVTGATSYQVYMYSSAKSAWVKKATVKTNSATIKSLSSATAYKFKVRAYMKDGKALYGNFSSAVSVYTKPAAVSSLSAAASTNSASLSWKKVSKATGYQIYVYSKGEWVKKASVSKNSYTLSSLSKLTDYKVKVRAYTKTSNGYVYGDYSAVKSFSTIPATVTNLTVSCSSSSKATLSWTAVSGADGYVVYVNEYTPDGKATSYVKYKSVSATSITVKGLTGNRTHRFKVRAYYKSDVNGYVYGNNTTSSVCRTKPSANDNFYWYEATNSSISLAWNEDPYVTGYQLYTLDENGKKVLLDTLDSSEISFTHTGLQEFTPYSYYLRAYYKTSSKTYYGDYASLENVKTDDSTVKDISFTKKKTSLTLGSTYTIKASVYPSYATNQGVSYKSSNTSVATISSSGKITAKSVGTTKITATSAEGGFSVSYTLKVTPITSTALDMPETVTLFVGYPCKIVPDFIPANTTDKSFTVTKKSDYTYSYKPLLGSKKTETLSFSDYITVDSNGYFTAKKATVEPNGDKNIFTFSVTFKASDAGGATKTIQVMVAEEPPTITLQNSDANEWYCSNTSKLAITLSNSLYFGEYDLSWESSDESIATVDEKGNITCVGAGDVTITAYSPYKVLSASCNITVREYCQFESTYFEKCEVGSTYRINATVLPKNSQSELQYYTTDSSVLTVNKTTGLVTVTGEGNARVIASIVGQPQDQWQIYFTTGSCEIPSGTDSELFSLLKQRANTVKSSADLIGFQRTEYATIDSLQLTNFEQTGVFSNLLDFENDFLLPILESKSKKTTSFVNSVSSSDSDYAEQWKLYLGKIPVAGQSKTILDSLELSDIKKIEVVNSPNSHVYGIKMTLNDETFNTLPTDITNTAHGSVFDILSKSYIDEIATNASADGMSFSLGYNKFKTTYRDSCVTLYVNKITGNINSLEYDMTLDANVSALDLTFSYSLFSFNYNCDITFTCNNVVKINFLKD